MIWMWICCVLTLATIYWYKKWSNYWKSRGVPFEKPFLIFGNLYNVLIRKEHMFDRILSIYKKHSTQFVGIFLLYKPALLVRSPQLLKKILVKDFDKFMNRNLPVNSSIDPLAFHTLFFATGKTWRNSRTKFSSAFTSSKVKSMFQLLQERAEAFCGFLRESKGEVIELKDLMKKYSTDVTAACVFGVETDCYTRRDSEFFKIASAAVDPNSAIRSFAIFCYFYVNSLVKLLRLNVANKKSTDYLGKIFSKMCSKRQEQSGRINDFVESVLTMIKDDVIKSDGYESPEVVSQALTFFTAGTDTTAMLLSFAFYELAKNQAIQDRLREEIQKVEKLTYEEIQDLKYLDSVVKEVMRKYPVGGILLRLAEEDYTIEDKLIEKGTSVLIPVIGLHYDPEYYPDPYQFDPERFNDENKNKIPNFAYLPFGEGPRYCIGKRLAISVLKTSVATILANFRFEAVAETIKSVEYDPACITVAQNRGGLYLRVVAI